MSYTRLMKAVAIPSLLLLISGCDLQSLTGTSSKNQPQKWELINDANQVATVVVTPFTNSGTFAETSGSAGWWINYGSFQVRIPVSGTISHTSQGDHWYFTITVTSGSVSLLGQGEGYSDGNYPNAVTAQGTTRGTLRDPGGTQAVTGSWRGYLNNR